MKKIFASLMVIVMCSIGLSSIAFAEEAQSVKQEKKVELTNKQQEEIKAIHQTILEQRKQLISKYVEFGQLSKERGDQLKDRLDQKFKAMEEMGFQMPPHHFHHGKHHQ